jgi:dihydrofolate reductase
MNDTKIIAIAAIGRNRELGKGNELIWQITNDLQRFRKLTQGHPLILGRKTFESIVAYRKSPLPDRTSIVVTRDPNWHYVHPNVVVMGSVELAIQLGRSLDPKMVYIGGGAEIYKAALAETTDLYLTQINAEASDADTFFPAYDEFSILSFDEPHVDEKTGLNYRYVNLKRP